jgi:hypothetical protein
MRLLYVLLLCFLLASQYSLANSIPKQLEIAKQYIGTKEENDNGGPQINIFLSSVGLRSGNSWCAAFVRYVLDKANIKNPNVRSGLAIKYITNNSIKAKHVAKGYFKIDYG